MPERLYDPRLDGISHSMLSSWLTCRQQCRYRVEGWTVVKPKESLSFGSMFHNMLRVVYDHFRKRKTPPSLTGLVRSATTRAFPWLDNYVEQQSRLTSDPKVIEMLQQQGAVCKAILPLYLKQWEDDFRSREWMDLEARFEVPFQGWVLKGIRDGIFVKVPKKGKRRSHWILETKTMARVSNDLQDLLAVDPQNLFYLFATYLETGSVPSGVDYNIIRRPTMKMGVSETGDEYAERVAEDIKSKPDTYFVRMEAAYATEDVMAFGDELAMKLRDFTKWAHYMDKHTYRNQSACIQRWTCEFLPACASGTMKGYVQRKRHSEEG